MLPPIPDPVDYDVSPLTGFLPETLPLETLPDPYYRPWEAVILNIQALLLSRRFRGVVDMMPVLSTDRLATEGEWKRACMVLAFMSHSYIWGGEKPLEILPPCISIPFLAVSAHVGLPPVTTYAAVCMWNFKPIFQDEPVDSLENLATLTTFTGSLDESWFYLVSVAIEARSGDLIPIMLQAIALARIQDSRGVTERLRLLAERIDELGTLLQRMYENCDPHIFYHRIRPFLAGSKNMSEAGLPNGVLYDTGSPSDEYRQYSGASAAQSSIIQLIDVILGVEHRPTGMKRGGAEGTAAPPSSRHAFTQEMRSYMPAPHRRFLEDVSLVANIRAYVALHRSDASLSTAYEACLAMLRNFRDKHIQMVSRYIIIKARESRSSNSRSLSPSTTAPKVINIASASSRKTDATLPSSKANSGIPTARSLRGTGGTALIPFLKQARDETGEPAIGRWAQKLLAANNGHAHPGRVELGKMEEHADGQLEIVGLAGTWAVDDSEGGLCHW